MLLQDGRVFATTLDIAKMFRKQYKNVVAAARTTLANVRQPAENLANRQNQQVSGWSRNRGKTWGRG